MDAQLKNDGDIPSRDTSHKAGIQVNITWKRANRQGYTHLRSPGRSKEARYTMVVD